MRQTVGNWRRRFIERGLDGLLDEPRPGAPRKLDDARIEQLIATTLNDRPREATHWSTRLLAKKLKVSQSSISLKPSMAFKGVLSSWLMLARNCDLW